ncbi:hypothetical protein IP88_14550 [alpha proteobacterium AAP81b]|nr:hypothetical protein IP88_14550 [alpha proteobacterium AAP81b]
MPYRGRVRGVLFLFLVLLAGPASAARLTGLTMTPGVITIATDGRPAAASAFGLGDPDRLVIDIPAVLPARLEAPGAGSVASVRAAMFAPGVARLVITLAAPLEIASLESTPGSLVIRLRRTSAAAFAANRSRRQLRVTVAEDSFELPRDAIPPASAAVVPKPATPGSAPPPPAGTLPPATVTPPSAPPTTLPVPPAGKPGDAADTAALAPPPRRLPGVRPRGGALPLVVVDAGHGGKDVGAISIDGGYEKDVTLAVARAVAAELRRSGRVRVKLTRDDDRFIPLGGRVTIARQARADLFISIHADAAPNPMARGASVYTLSAVASDAVAARLAARENKADIIGGVNLAAIAPDVGDIMIDLSRRATTNVSVAFADVLQESLNDEVNFRSEFHHFAGFAVLKAPDVPSVLLETGYVTNRDDAALLFSDAGRRRIAAAIARAVERHLLGD